MIGRILLSIVLLLALISPASSLMRDYGRCESDGKEITLSWLDGSGWVITALDEHGINIVPLVFSRDSVKQVRVAYKEAVKKMWKLPNGSSDLVGRLPGLDFMAFNENKKHVLSLCFKKGAHKVDYLIWFDSGQNTNNKAFEKLLNVTNQTW